MAQTEAESRAFENPNKGLPAHKEFKIKAKAGCLTAGIRDCGIQRSFDT